MPDLNKCMLMGRLVRDPDLRYLPSNTAVVSLSIAINRRWKNQAGESQEETTYLDAESFGKQGEVINQYFRKGDPIFIEGRIKQDVWQDRDGNNRSKLKVVVESFEFLKGRTDRTDRPSDEPRGRGDTGGRLAGARTQADDDDDSRIPF